MASASLKAVSYTHLDVYKRQEDELRRGCTLVGPHRDEVLFTIDGRSARDFGSQGDVYKRQALALSMTFWVTKICWMTCQAEETS